MSARDNQQTLPESRAWPCHWAFLLGLPLLLATLAPILGGPLSLQPPTGAGEHWMTPEFLAQNRGDFLSIDTRDPEAYARAHIPGALNLDPRDYEQGLQRVLMEWTPERRIVVYCSTRSCGQSTAVAHALEQDLGLDSVWVLEGGWEAWLNRSSKSP